LSDFDKCFPHVRINTGYMMGNTNAKYGGLLVIFEPYVNCIFGTVCNSTIMKQFVIIKFRLFTSYWMSMPNRQTNNLMLI
jgi:antibiotic biosynthesis monooxygenase (ABM) superfamily enzyme